MMKRLLLLWVSLLMICSLSAQQTKHTVQRGETYASIAGKYGVSEQALRAANPYNKNLYVGIKLVIPSVSQNTSVSGVAPTVSSQGNTAMNRVAQAYMDNAWGYYHDMKYGKAIKEIEKALAENAGMEAYLLRGKCHLMRNKYKNACEDFALVMDSPSATAAQKQEAYSENQTAVRLWETKRAEKAQFWGKIAQDAVAIAQDMANQKMMEDQMVARAGNATKDKEFNKNLQNIYRQAGKQQRKEQLEGYMSFKTTMKNVTGQDVSYAEYRKLQVEQFTEEQKAKRAAAVEALNSDDEDEVEEEKEKPKSKSTSSSASSTTQKTTTTNTAVKKPATTVKTTAKKKKEEEDLDAKQQWKRGMVSSDEFREIRGKKVNLYRRHGGKGELTYEHKQIYEKGGEYFVKIGSTFYEIEYSNWGAFNKMIIKGAEGNMYFNVHL